MKKLLFALLSLCAVGAAHAVNVSWSAAGDAAIAGQSQTLAAAGQSFSLAVALTTHGLEGTSNSLIVSLNKYVGIAGTGLMAYKVSEGLGAHFQGTNGGVQSWFQAAGSSSSLGQHVEVLTGTWNVEAKRWDIAWFHDGAARPLDREEPVAWMTPDKNGKLVATFVDGSEWTFDRAVIYEGVLTRDEIAEVTQTLPEPTALALLALGVAGLALRRRAA